MNETLEQLIDSINEESARAPLRRPRQPLLSTELATPSWFAQAWQETLTGLRALRKNGKE